MEGPPKQPDNPNIVAIIALTLVGALAVYVAFISLQAYYLAEVSELELEREAEGQSYEVRALYAKHAEELQGYRWVNKHRQTVTLPIDKAMEIVVSEVRSGNPNNLVPAIGPQDTPTIPAVFGRPADNAQMPGPSGQEGATATQEAGGTGEAAEGEGAGGEAAEGEAAGGAVEETGAPAEGAGADSAAPAQDTAAPSGEQATTGDNAPADSAAGTPGDGTGEPAGPASDTGGNATP